jgi:hypothetical protein
MIKITLITCCLLCGNNSVAQGKFFGGNGDGFATATINNTVLPVQVLHFAVQTANNGVTASLQLGSAQNLCAVQLEKSDNGIVFTPAGAVQNVAAGAQTYFSFFDAAGNGGTVYYRAALVHCNGQVVYTQAVPVRPHAATRFYVAGNRLHYQQAAGMSTVNIYNAAAQCVYAARLNGQSGMLLLNGLTAGVYWVKCGNVPVRQIVIW